MRKYSVVFFLGLALSQLCAQTFTDHLQQTVSGGANIIVHQSDTLTNLVNGTLQIEYSDNSRAKNESKTLKTNMRKGSEATEQKKQSENDTTIEDHTKKALGRSYRTYGYRIQIYAGGNSRESRMMAENMAIKVKHYLSDEPVYTHFYSPRWICRVGNYTNYAEAAKMLRELRSKGFDESVIVKCQVQIAY